MTAEGGPLVIYNTKHIMSQMFPLYFGALV